MDMLDGETEVRDYNLERLMMLSDGVFAIAMTLLALELRPPEHWDGQIGSLFKGVSDALFAFFWSFGSIAILWASHRQSFGRFRRADFGLSLYTLVFLGLITLIPAATQALAQSHYSMAIIWLYVGLFQAIAIVNTLIWCHAAFFTDIAKPGMSLRLKVVVALILLFLGPIMTLLGVSSSQPSLRWATVLIPVVGFGAGWVRRWASKG